MENYGNTGVKVLGKFHVFLRWKDQVFKQLFYVTDCDKSPNLLSRGACYTLGVLKQCYTVEKELGLSSSSTESTHSQVTPIHITQVGKSFLHCKNDGNTEEVANSSSKCFISREQLQGAPLTKRDILEVYSDVFSRIGKFPGETVKEIHFDKFTFWNKSEWCSKFENKPWICSGFILTIP